MSTQSSNLINLQLDGNKLLHHLDRVDDWITNKEVFPIYIALSPTSLCNHGCSFCVYNDKGFSPIFFPKQRYFELVDEWSKLGIKSIFMAGDGEPLLNKDLVEMVSYTKSKKIDIALNTNGVLLTKNKVDSIVENLSWIRFSINAGSAKTYAKIHNTQERDFETVLKNITYLVKRKKELKKNITIGVQCVLIPENVNEVEELVKLYKEAGVDYVAVKPFLKHPDGIENFQIENLNDVLEELSSLSKYSSETFSFNMRENNFKKAEKRTYCKCLAGPFMLEIDAKGDVYNCGPFIGNTNHCYGNLMDQTFLKLWRSDKKRSVMDFVQNKVDVNKCMPFCRPDSVNRFLSEIKNPPQHVNYI